MHRLFINACLFFLLSSASICYAATYQLTVDNETGLSFLVQTNQMGPHPELNAYDRDRRYESEWSENKKGTRVIQFRFIGKRDGGREVYVIGHESDKTDRRVFCSSGSICLACRFVSLDENAGKLTIYLNPSDQAKKYCSGARSS